MKNTNSGPRRARRSEQPRNHRTTSLILAATLAVVLFVGAGVFAFNLFKQDAPAAAGTPSYQAAPTAAAPFGPDAPDSYVPGGAPDPKPAGPSSVTVGSVGISTGWEARGLLPGKKLDLPATTAAWYNQSAPIDATAGSTVLSAHINSPSGGEGPFWGLADVAKGAPVEIQDATGTKSTYKVSELVTVPKDQSSPGWKKYELKWFTLTGPRQIVLVTCGGPMLGFDEAGIPIYKYLTVAVATPVGGVQ